MYFKEPKHLKLVAPIMLQILKLPTQPSDTIGLYRRILINRMCRELEKLVKIGKSKRAQDNARSCGIEGDLSTYTWARRNRLRDKHEEGFHFEHTETVYELARSLAALQNPTLVEVEIILARAQVTWVTSRENQKIDELGFKSRRSDWRKAYEQAGIVLAENE